MTCSVDASLVAERDVIEQRIADGKLCRADGKRHDWQQQSQMYGEDRDGNRGVRVYFNACSKCGDEK